jgi:DNA-binding response OmpR family regulator
MKILVAEDNSVTATLMSGILTRHGYTVVLAQNGSEALRLLESNPDIQGVITDIMMPESSGLDLLRALRAHEEWRNLPTIVTTVRDDSETVTEAVSLGCKEYILKPFRPARLIERVEKVFRENNKVILMSSAQVIGQYSLNLETYRRISDVFAAQVDEAIVALENWSTNPSTIRRVDVTPIMESATVMGAECLLAALEEAAPALRSSQLQPDQCARLLEQLQLVREARNRQGG